MAEKAGELLTKARGALEPIWEKCKQDGFIARGWPYRGKGSNSPFPGSNIILCDGITIVVIWQENETGPIECMTFERADNPGTLEQEVRAILREHLRPEQIIELCSQA